VARKTAGSAEKRAKRPVRLSLSHSRMRRRNCSSSGADRTAPPKEGPAGPQGGLQARGSFVSGQQLAAARRPSLPSTCFVGGHLVEPMIPVALGTVTWKFGDGPRPCRAGEPRISYHQLLHQTATVTRAPLARAQHRATGWQSGPERITECSAPSTGRHAGPGLSVQRRPPDATLVPVSTRFTGLDALDLAAHRTLMPC